MKRAISPIVATILIITVTVALAGGLLIFIMNLQSRMTTSSAEAPTLYNLRINPGTVTCSYNKTTTVLDVSFYGEAIGETIPGDVQVILTIKDGTGKSCFSQAAGTTITIADLFGGPINPGQFNKGEIKINMTGGVVYVISSAGTKQIGTWTCGVPSDQTQYVFEVSTAKSAQPATFSIQLSPGDGTCKS